MAPRGPRRPAERQAPAALALLVLAGAAFWWCQSGIAAGTSFVAGSAASPRGLPRAAAAAAQTLRGRRRELRDDGASIVGRDGATTRRGAFAFDWVQTDDHDGLVIEEEEDGSKSISTQNAGEIEYGKWNTVLGDTELPATGRAYWEVKLAKKPTNAWEYIGVAEPSADVTVPLAKNQKGAGWFWGGTWSDSFLYQHNKPGPEWNAKAVSWTEWLVKDIAETKGFPEKDMMEQFMGANKDRFKGPGVPMGIDVSDSFPSFRPGLTVGIDVDMDKGQMGFWANGEFMGLLKDPLGKPVDLKGKKLVPALSVFGRTNGKVDQYTVMEVKTGLDPPAV